MRELMEQGYAVIAPDYRGSTGYGQAFYQHIDYGGREVDDVFAGPPMDARNLQPSRSQARRSHRLEPRRIHHADGYSAASRRLTPSPTPACPVSDLVLRLGYDDARITHCIRRRITSEKPFATILRNTNDARPSPGCRSSRRPC